MANNNSLTRRNEAARALARTKAKRAEKRKAAKAFAVAQSTKPLRVRLGLTKH